MLDLLDPSLVGLPLLPRGVTTAAITSYDRTGGNDDGFSGAYSFLRREGSEYVLFDETGPGCVVRFWMSGLYALLGKPLPGTIRFTFDGESTPRLDLPLARLFDGTRFPFLKPLVGDEHDSSGGFYSYVPVCFASRLKITTDENPYFYHLWFQTYPAGTPVGTYDGYAGAESAIRRLAGTWSNAGLLDPPAGGPGFRVVEGSGTVPPSGSLLLADLRGGGTVRDLRLWIDRSADPADLRFTARWDEGATPSVDAPLPDFFGCGIGRAPVRSLPVGMDADPSRPFYARFPMPFQDSARLELAGAGGSGAPVRYRILVDGSPPDRKAGYFHALYRSGPTTEGEDWTFLDTPGGGRWVGVVLTMAGPESRNHLEGDDRTYTNGAPVPAIHGTGTEDFFNGGWYFEYGPFTLPLHGNPAHVPGAIDRTCAYRFFLADAVAFEEGLRAGIEHGPVGDDVPAVYSSVAYWYAPRP